MKCNEVPIVVVVLPRKRWKKMQLSLVQTMGHSFFNSRVWDISGIHLLKHWESVEKASRTSTIASLFFSIFWVSCALVATVGVFIAHERSADGALWAGERSDSTFVSWLASEYSPLRMFHLNLRWPYRGHSSPWYHFSSPWVFPYLHCKFRCRCHWGNSRSNWDVSHCRVLLSSWVLKKRPKRTVPHTQTIDQNRIPWSCKPE